MTVIKRSAIVPYTQRQMFELVDNIEEYPRFLPWCNNSHILSRSENEVDATLEIAFSGVHKSFTTRNTLHHYDRIVLSLVEGPFKHLSGTWVFTPLGEHGCKVNMELEFEFGGSLIEKLIQPVFNRIVNSLVDAFCKRAVDIYGTR